MPKYGSVDPEKDANAIRSSIRIGTKTWRWIHFSGFLTFAMVMVHGVASGTDSHTLWASLMYWVAGGSLLLLLYYRILVTVGVGRARKAAAIHAPAEPSAVAGSKGSPSAQPGD